MSAKFIPEFLHVLQFVGSSIYWERERDTVGYLWDVLMFILFKFIPKSRSLGTSLHALSHINSPLRVKFYSFHLKTHAYLCIFTTHPLIRNQAPQPRGCCYVTVKDRYECYIAFLVLSLSTSLHRLHTKSKPVLFYFGSHSICSAYV